MRRCVVFALGVATACRSDAVKFGRVTDDSKQAVHDWCKGDLEMESKIAPFADKRPVFDGPNLLIMHCLDSGSAHESGWLAFDSVTGDLINVFFSLHPSDFDDVLSHAVLPSLDTEQRAGYDDLRGALAKATNNTTKRWERGKAHMDVEAIQITAPNSEPIWEFMLGYKKAPEER